MHTHTRTRTHTHTHTHTHTRTRTCTHRDVYLMYCIPGPKVFELYGAIVQLVLDSYKLLANKIFVELTCCLQMILLLMGMKKATSKYVCVWCKVESKDRYVNYVCSYSYAQCSV